LNQNIDMITAAKELHPNFITDEFGKKISVILSMTEFESLLEDLSDLAATVERADEPSIPHSQVVTKLKENSLI